jgi:methanogenic corrinoid protein MtbC1
VHGAIQVPFRRSGHAGKDEPRARRRSKGAAAGAKPIRDAPKLADAARGPAKGVVAMRSGSPGADPARTPRGGGSSSAPTRAAVRVAFCGLVGLAAGIGVALTGISPAGALLVLAFALAAAGAGWQVGDIGHAALQDEIEGRSSELNRALAELKLAQSETVKRLSMAVEYRDEDTGAHIERIGNLSALLAEQIGMDQEFCMQLKLAAPLHDVGKVAIPDAILLKPGPLTPEERTIVETHAEEGYRILRGSSSEILELASRIALGHQEKWDGSGYPRGLAGEAIPIESRIVAVADVFDALTSDRVYRKAFSVEKALELMRNERGRHFDPVLLDAFMEVIDAAGPDARERVGDDPAAVAERTLEVYGAALERGDAETAEGAIASAIDDGVPPAMLHGEVIAPALRRMRELRGVGALDLEHEHLSQSITRRVLATLSRYMTGGREPSREKVLVAGLQGDEHTLELQMIHDQLAAAGYATTLDTELPLDELQSAVADRGADIVVLGAISAGVSQQVGDAIKALRRSKPGVLVVLGGIAAGGELPDVGTDARTLERIDEAVEAVEELLAGRARAGSI